MEFDKKEKIWWIVTACIISRDNELRETQYREGLTNLLKLIEKTKEYFQHKIIIVEGNGERQTFFNEYLSENIEIVYTNNNSIITKNIGVKETADIKEILQNKKSIIDGKDWIIKLTGRYQLNDLDSCQFMQSFLTSRAKISDAIYRPGNCDDIGKPVESWNIKDCISGLIAMRASFWYTLVSQSQLEENECTEWRIATHIQTSIKPERIIYLFKLGISIAPGSNNFIDV